MAHESGIQFFLAECTNGYDKTYQRIQDSAETDNSEYLYTISALLYSANDDTGEIYAKPYTSTAFFQPPLSGEHVFVFKALSPDNNGGTEYDQWYYIPAPIAMATGINNNLAPGASGNENETDQFHEDKAISPLQVYSGDVVSQGRWGNTIRLGSTVNEMITTESPNWVEGEPGDPLIILSNTKTNRPNKEFVVEDIAEDHSSLWLSSTQRLTTLNLHYNLKESTGKDSTNTNNISQFIGIGDRVILHSKSDVVALDSQLAIEMRAPKLVMGGDGDKFGILDSRAVMDALFLIRSIIAYGLEGPASQKISLSEYGRQQSTELFELLLNLTNDNILIDRKSNV